MNRHIICLKKHLGLHNQVVTDLIKAEGPQILRKINAGKDDACKDFVAHMALQASLIHGGRIRHLHSGGSSAWWHPLEHRWIAYQLVWNTLHKNGVVQPSIPELWSEEMEQFIDQFHPGPEPEKFF